MKIPQAFRRPFYNRSEIHPNGSTKQDSSGKSERMNKIQPDEETHNEPVGFWHPGLRKVRNRAFAKWTVTTAFLMAFILAVLSIFWGVFLQVEQRLNHLQVYVVDMDGAPPYDTDGNQPFIGPTIVELAQKQLNSGQPTLGWSIRSGSEFGNDPIQVRQAIYDFKAWAAIVINPNATAMLFRAVAEGNSSYDPLGACQLIYEDARDDTNWFDFISPIMTQFMTQSQAQVGQRWAEMILQNASDPTALANIQAVPQAVNPAIGFSEFNLRPFFPYTAIPAVSIGLIYLIIISFFSFSFYIPIHMQYLSSKGHPPLKFGQLIVWRWVATIMAYLFLSLAYSFVSMAFQINFFDTNPITSETQATIQEYGNPIAYGHGTFPVYWMLNFFGMIALGLACENMAMIVGMPWMGLFLIFWVITNVSTAFYDIEIAPGFYRWGYAWPLHSIVEASRQILFGLHSRIGLDFGILLSWGAVNTALFPLCCWFQRWKTQNGVHEYWPTD